MFTIKVVEKDGRTRAFEAISYETVNTPEHEVAFVAFTSWGEGGRGPNFSAPVDGRKLRHIIVENSAGVIIEYINAPSLPKGGDSYDR